jgi:hypothetical protein
MRQDKRFEQSAFRSACSVLKRTLLYYDRADENFWRALTFPGKLLSIAPLSRLPLLARI